MKASWTLWTVGLAALATTPGPGWAVAVTDHLGSAPHLNTGISADLNLGLALGF